MSDIYYKNVQYTAQVFTIVVKIDGLLGETRKVDDVIAIRVYVQKFYAGPKVVHELA